jgi:N-ethylmaleimide reductase
VIDAYRQAAKNALQAGFDGVEVHGANGYLIEQFLQSHTNLRTDQYGGSIENRTRFLMEVTRAVIDVWGADRVGLRLSPYGVANGSGEPDPMPLYTHAIQSLNPLGLAYLHFIEPRSSGAGRAEVNHQNVPSAMVLFRPIWKGVLMTAGGFTGEAANAAIADSHADAVAFGRIFISNPDLPRRLQRGYPLTPIAARHSTAAIWPAIPIIPCMTNWRRRELHRHCDGRDGKGKWQEQQRPQA